MIFITQCHFQFLLLLFLIFLLAVSFQVFFIRDGILFPDMIHAVKANPKSNIQEVRTPLSGQVPSAELDSTPGWDSGSKGSHSSVASHSHEGDQKSFIRMT